MNKKILIGSIIAVAILVGVSFTSVVGYDSIKSNSVKSSPLFNIRASRAINQEDDVLFCEYVGKGEESGLAIPKRDESTRLIGRLINEIKKMDKNKIQQLRDFLQNHIDFNDIKNIDNVDVNNIPNQLKNNPMFKEYFNPTNNKINDLKINQPEVTYIEIKGWCIIEILTLIIVLITSPIWFPIFLIILAIIGIITLLAVMIIYAFIWCGFHETFWGK